MMKKALLVFSCFALALCSTTTAFGKNKKQECTTIQEGELTYATDHYLAGQPLQTGFDPYGYNYQGHMFSGYYANAYLGGDGFPPYDGDDEGYLLDNPDVANTWYWPYRNDQVLMKWNDAWLSNKDCDADGNLDRHYGFESYIGLGAWETNHQSGEYLSDDGSVCNWVYFVKIVAVPADSEKVDGIWYTAEGEEIGPDIWGQFAIIQEVYNDTCTGDHGAAYISPVGPGLGKW